MKKTQTDVAYEYIKSRIITTFYFPGSHLVEEDLVRDTGVSRTSVRAALSRLRYEGIVEGSPNRGMIIKRFSARTSSMSSIPARFWKPRPLSWPSTA